MGDKYLVKTPFVWQCAEVMCQLREKNIATTSLLPFFFFFSYPFRCALCYLIDWCLFLKPARGKPTLPSGCLVGCGGIPLAAWPEGSIRDCWGRRERKMSDVASHGHHAAMCNSFSPITQSSAAVAPGSSCELAIAEMISYRVQPFCQRTDTVLAQGRCFRSKASSAATESFPCESLCITWNNTEKMYEKDRGVQMENLQTRSGVYT